ncbi:MAG: NAD(P)-dependent oxidoreductase [Blautia sp.]
MKLLHIGKPGNMERFTPKNLFTDSVTKIDLPAGLKTEEYLVQAGDADFLIIDPITWLKNDLISQMPNLKLIHSEGVAFNKIDLDSATRNGIYVCNCAGANASAVAEQTLLLILGVLRDVVNNETAVRTGQQLSTKENYMVHGSLKELADCTVGLIGFGAIGKATAALLKPFGAEVYYYKRSPLSNQEEEAFHVKYLPLDELLHTCNMVSLHVPVTPETTKMCNDAFFENMQDGSYLINTSRGELVDNEALIRALHTGKLAMAGLDTLDNEPVQKNHILLNQPEDICKKMLLSPHIGGITGSSFRRSYEMIWNSIEKITKGEKPDHIVNSL